MVGHGEPKRIRHVFRPMNFKFIPISISNQLSKIFCNSLHLGFSAMKLNHSDHWVISFVLITYVTTSKAYHNGIRYIYCDKNVQHYGHNTRRKILGPWNSAYKCRVSASQSLMSLRKNIILMPYIFIPMCMFRWLRMHAYSMRSSVWGCHLWKHISHRCRYILSLEKSASLHPITFGIYSKLESTNRSLSS